MEAADRFAEIVSTDDFRLARAFLAFDAVEHPGLDEDAYLARTDALGDEVAGAVAGAAGPADVLEAIGEHLSARGFHGNAEDYYDPRNSYLHHVLDRGLGIPISLAVVWIEAGRRCGLPLVGVGMPSHVLVGWSGEDVHADAFGGRVFRGTDEVLPFFGVVTGGRVPWSDAYLRPADDRDLVRRALTNLKASYTQTGRLRRALRIVELLLRIPGAAPSELRDRATIRTGLGGYREAIADLTTYLDSEPPDAEQTKAEIRRLRAIMN